ncbi:MAG: protein kinase [Planctomycetota bacterium]
MVHRDIKPSNLLLDESGVAWITDFGLAKGEESDLTRAGDVVGTVRYMSPERFDGVCDARVDVYSLGLVLYEILARSPAFGTRDRVALIDDILNRRPAPLRSSDGRVPRDLETVVLRAIEKDPRKRYPSAAALADDLRRFVGGEPIAARRLSQVELCWSWARRNRALAATLVSLFVVLTASTIGFGIAAFRFHEQRESERVMAETNAAMTQRALAAEQVAVSSEHRETRLRQKAEDERRVFRDWAYFSDMTRARDELREGAGTSGVTQLIAPWGERPEGVDFEDLRGWEWYFFRAHCVAPFVRLARKRPTTCVRFSPDGSRFATANQNLVSIWSVDGSLEREIKQPGLVRHFAWSHDSRSIAMGLARQVLIQPVDSSCEPRKLKHPARVSRVALDGVRGRIATSAEDGKVRIWATTGEKPTRVIAGDGRSPRGLAWSPDGRRLAIVSGLRTRIWLADEGEFEISVPSFQLRVNEVRWSPDSRCIALASRGGSIEVWNVVDRAAVCQIETAVPIECLAWSPDGTKIASGDHERVVRIWHATRGVELFSLRGHSQPIVSVDWSQDGSSLLVGDRGTTIRLWEAAPTVKRRLTGVSAFRIAWRDEERVSGFRMGFLTTWDAVEGRLETRHQLGESAAHYATSWHPVAPLVAWAKRDDTEVWLLDEMSGTSRRCFAGGATKALSWSPEGRHLAVVEKTKARIVDGVTFQSVRDIEGLKSPHLTVWSRDGRRVAIVEERRNVRVFDVVSGAPIAQREPNLGLVLGLDWGPGATLVTSTSEGVVAEWNVDTGAFRRLAELPASAGQAKWSPDGKRIAVASKTELWLLDPKSGSVALRLSCDKRIHRIAWNPSGTRIAASQEIYGVSVWDASSGYAAPTGTGRPSLRLKPALRPTPSEQK